MNTAEDRFKQCFEVIKSFLYFVLHFVYIEDKETFRAIKFDLWPSQLNIIPKIISDSWLIILKARQLGLTWIVAAYCLWLAITRPLQQILVISYNQDVAQEFVARIRFMLARLPDWLVPPIKRDTTEILEFSHSDDEGNPVNSIIQSLPTTPKGGQSKTPTLLVVDESAWNQYFKEIYTATEPGIEAAKARIIVISNAMKRAPGWAFTRELMTNAVKGLNKFLPVFMPWWDRPGRPTDEVWDENEKKMIPRFIWIEKNEKNKSDDDISEHYPATLEEAISTLGGSYFGRALKVHNEPRKGISGDISYDKTDKEAKFIEDPRGILEIWRYPYYLLNGWNGTYWSNRYCIGADVSEGLGETYSVSYVMDRHHNEFVARLRSNRIYAHQFAELLNYLSMYYANTVHHEYNNTVSAQKALVCVERTGAGQTTTQILAEKNANQYVRVKEGVQGAGMTKEYGWAENEQSKHNLCEDLRDWLREATRSVYCPFLIDECSTWIKHEGSRKLGPESDKYGDCVIAAGCTIQASIFLGAPPKKFKLEHEGWLYQWQHEHDSARAWAL